MLFRRFAAQTIELLLLVLFLFDRKRMPVAFHKLFERNAVDENSLRDSGILRRHMSLHVTPLIPVPLPIAVLKPRLPVMLCRGDRQLHDLGDTKRVGILGLDRKLAARGEEGG